MLPRGGLRTAGAHTAARATVVRCCLRPRPGLRGLPPRTQLRQNGGSGGVTCATLGTPLPAPRRQYWSVTRTSMEIPQPGLKGGGGEERGEHGEPRGWGLCEREERAR